MRPRQSIQVCGVFGACVVACAVGAHAVSFSVALQQMPICARTASRRFTDGEPPHPARDKVLHSSRSVRGEAAATIIALEQATNQKVAGMFDKLHHFLDEDHPIWRHNLAMAMEGRFVTGSVLLLVVMDIVITLFVVLAENTDILNPRYHLRTQAGIERSKKVAVALLSAFVLEQVGHLIAFGWSFFRKPWCVLDLVIVLVSLIIELKEAQIMERIAAKDALSPKAMSKARVLGRTVTFLRLWKFAAFTFDLMYVGMLRRCMEEQAHQAVTHYIRSLESELVRRGIPLPIA
mmetsp:Transcript_58715/g.137006  ORF Transcript_58715/g.137006 Transcript_58715/m.137006 type:complete len:291 (-) Transcript_58715:252-1124(-)